MGKIFVLENSAGSKLNYMAMNDCSKPLEFSNSCWVSFSSEEEAQKKKEELLANFKEEREQGFWSNHRVSDKEKWMDDWEKKIENLKIVEYQLD